MWEIWPSNRLIFKVCSAIWRQLTGASQQTVQGSLRSADWSLSAHARGRTDRLGWIRLTQRMETKHEMSLFQIEGWSRRLRSRFRCWLHSVEAQDRSVTSSWWWRHTWKSLSFNMIKFLQKLVLPNKSLIFFFFFKTKCKNSPGVAGAY